MSIISIEISFGDDRSRILSHSVINVWICNSLGLEYFVIKFIIEECRCIFLREKFSRIVPSLHCAYIPPHVAITAENISGCTFNIKSMYKSLLKI